MVYGNIEMKPEMHDRAVQLLSKGVAIEYERMDYSELYGIMALVEACGYGMEIIRFIESPEISFRDYFSTHARDLSSETPYSMELAGIEFTVL